MYRRMCCWRCNSPCSTQCSRCKMAFYCGKECQKADKWRHKVDCDAACVKRTCAACWKTSECIPCVRCEYVWYCNRECQRNYRAQHKSDCQTKVKSVQSITNEIRRYHELRSTSPPGLGYVYYWGNVPAVDLINLPTHEGTNYCKPLDLLLCGVGDPRNVVLSLASLPDCYTENVTFVLNDICSCVLARTLLLLYMLYRKGENEEVASSVTQIWYSVLLTQKHFQFLTTTLEEMTSATDLRGLTDGVMEMPADQFSRLQNVWKTWLELSSQTEPWIDEQRKNRFLNDPQSEAGIALYVNEVPTEHKKSCAEWFTSGVLLPHGGRVGLVKENPTMTGSSFQLDANQGPFRYCISPDTLPFTGWDYLGVREFCHKPCVQEMYSEYVCHVLTKCRDRIKSGQAKFQIILSDCMKMQPFLPTDVKYDRILTSNLSDYIPLGNLLRSFQPLQKESNECATIVTETLNWMRTFFPSIMSSLKMSLSFLGSAQRVPAMKDTKNQVIGSSDGGTGHIEYWDLTEEFETYLKASLLACESPPELYDRMGDILPSVTKLAQSYGVMCRKFLRNENSIMPFRWPVNCRRVTMIKGSERAVEWVLLCETQPDL